MQMPENARLADLQGCKVIHSPAPPHTHMHTDRVLTSAEVLNNVSYSGGRKWHEHFDLPLLPVSLSTSFSYRLTSFPHSVHHFSLSRPHLLTNSALLTFFFFFSPVPLPWPLLMYFLMIICQTVLGHSHVMWHSHRSNVCPPPLSPPQWFE